jgi:hypothetical protein
MQNKINEFLNTLPDKIYNGSRYNIGSHYITYAVGIFTLFLGLSELLNFGSFFTWYHWILLYAIVLILPLCFVLYSDKKLKKKGGHQHE